MSNKPSEIGIRALKTFVQSALAVLAASGSGYIHIGVVKAAIVAGGAAAISFLTNALNVPPQP
jgi:hypothetical protein